MAPKPKAQPKLQTSKGGYPFKNREGLGAYLSNPETFPASIVIDYNDDFVIIHDKFPKASVHTLILPRSPSIYSKHPIDALADPELLAKIKVEVARVKKLVAAELQRNFGKFSRSEAEREAVLNGEVEPTGSDLPDGRNWLAEVKCGIHAVPSMSHLHIHVLSRDMHSEALKHRKHYNSFNTPFLVDVDEFPLAEDDGRRDTKEEGYLRWDMKCWRCGKNFGNQFKQLKEHLEVEFEAWKKE